MTMLKNFGESIQNCTKIETLKVMTWEPGQQKPTTQTLQHEGKLPQMNSRLSISANENDIVLSVDSTRKRQATKEILLVHGEKSERGVVQVYDDEVNHSIYNYQIEACCFLLRLEHVHLENGLEEDNERVTFTGKLHVGISDLGVFGKEVASCVVDRLAEGAWNCYFGKSSKWHYMRNLSKESETNET